MDNALVKISAARTALESAKGIKEVKQIRDQAQAIESYAKRQKDLAHVQNSAADLKIRAQRKLGQLIPQHYPQGRPGKKSLHDVRLKDDGITFRDSHRWQCIAAMPEDVFEQSIAGTVDAGAELTTSLLYKKSKQYQAKNPTKKTSIPKQMRGRIFHSFDELRKIGDKFGTVYIDPPWKYSNQGTRASTDNHYSTLTVDELIEKFPIQEVTLDKCHLHLWTTNGFLFECPKIFQAWGFEFKSSFVWVKPQMGIGNYWRNAHEILLLAVRGGQTALSKSEMSWINCPRGKHSSKPDRVRESIERLSPGPFLEIFGRRAYPNWTVVGDQFEELEMA